MHRFLMNLSTIRKCTIAIIKHEVIINILSLIVIKNSLSFCFSWSLSFPYYLPAELGIVILEV